MYSILLYQKTVFVFRIKDSLIKFASSHYCFIKWNN